MFYDAVFIHYIMEESTLVVTFRKSLINPGGVFLLLHNKSTMKGSLPFIYALQMEIGKVGPGKYCKKESPLRVWWCPS